MLQRDAIVVRTVCNVTATHEDRFVIAPRARSTAFHLTRDQLCASALEDLAPAIQRQALDCLRN